MKKRIFSRVLALVMALSLLTTTVFAASLDDLQEAIDGTYDVEVTDDTTPVEDAKPADEMPAPSESEDPAEPTVPTEPAEPVDETHVNGALVRQDKDDDGNVIQNYFGYGWSSVTENDTTTWTYAIEAHDKDGNRFVVLLDNVDSSGEATGVVIGQDGVKSDVTIDMKGHDITGSGEGAVITVKENATLNLNNGTVSGSEIGIDVLGNLFLDSVTVANNGTGIKINDGGKVTFNGKQNKVNGNDKNLVGTGKVTFKLDDKEYKVDVKTAETLLADKDSIATHGADWILTKSGTVIYTGIGNNGQLSDIIVKKILSAAKSEGGKISGFVIPDGITTIGTQAFKDQKELKSVTLPDSVTNIGLQAFQNCDGLTEIVLPSSLTTIGQQAFSGCTALTQISIPDSVTKIDHQAFEKCTGLTKIIIPQSVKDLAANCLYGCSKLETVEIASQSETLPKIYSSNLKTLIISGGVKEIPQSYAEHMKNVETLKITTNTLTTIGWAAFQDCVNLSTVELAEGVTKIAGHAFERCKNLTSIAIPASVTTIGEVAFQDCSLKTLEIPANSSLVSLSGNAFYKSGLKSIVINPTGEQTVDTLVTVLRSGLYCNLYVNHSDKLEVYKRSSHQLAMEIPHSGEFAIDKETGAATVSQVSTLKITKGTTTTDITLPENAKVSVSASGPLLTIPNVSESLKFAVKDTSGDRTAIWTATPTGNESIVINENEDIITATLPAGSTIASDKGFVAATTAASTIEMRRVENGKRITDGRINTLGEVTFTDAVGNALVFTPGVNAKNEPGRIWVDPTGIVTIFRAGSVDDGNGGKTSYPSGATMEDGQITSNGDVEIDGGSNSQTVVKPAESNEAPVTVDSATGITSVPEGGSTIMNDGANEVSYPGGATVDRNGNVTSTGNVEYMYDKSEGTVTPPAGSNITIGADGAITVPAGSTIGTDGYPYGAVIHPDGTIEAFSAPPEDVISPDFSFDAMGATADSGTTITDEEIPLAGLISRAQLVSFLYTHEGSPDGEDAEGEYTLAMAWAVAKEIVDEEDDPDEIVTVAILREVMTNYAAYLDTTFDVVIEGEDDMIVMNCDEILAEFYASLEDKAA